MLICADQTCYTGITTNPLRRCKAHNEGKGARYTRARRPVHLAWLEECADRSAAAKREYEIKQLSRTGKLELARGRMQRD